MQGIQRQLALLDAISDAHEASIIELRLATGLAESTAHRILEGPECLRKIPEEIEWG